MTSTDNNGGRIESANKVRLVCLPYAGGSSTTYLSWKKLLAKGIELVPVELAGRHKRRNDPFYADMNEAVLDVRAIISRLAGDCAYALFGHSMGTIIVYELIRILAREGAQLPVHVFFSGRFPPFVETEKTEHHTLPDAEFIKQMGQFGGDFGVFDDPEFRDYALPILRNDYRLVETYAHTGDRLTLESPVTLMSGTLDRLVSRDSMDAWRACARAKCSLYELDGDHFFINTHREKVVSIVNSELGAYISDSRPS
jgi:medium-chain acyl-[acyl-carrier-protein] hydrolase